MFFNMLLNYLELNVLTIRPSYRGDYCLETLSPSVCGRGRSFVANGVLALSRFCKEIERCSVLDSSNLSCILVTASPIFLSLFMCQFLYLSVCFICLSISLCVEHGTSAFPVVIGKGYCVLSYLHVCTAQSLRGDIETV